jgi:hypothetical protein
MKEKTSYYMKHREKKLAYARQYARDHYDAIRARRKADYIEFAEVIKAKRREYYLANREKCKEYGRRYQAALRAEVISLRAELAKLRGQK